MRSKIIPLLMAAALISASAAAPVTAQAAEETGEGAIQYATPKKTIKVYTSQSGKKSRKLKAYSRLEIEYTSGSRYKVKYTYKGSVKTGWISSSDYTDKVLLYDGSDKRNIADGVYTVSPKNSSKKMLTLSDGGLTLSETDNSEEQRFTFSYAGSGYYRISAQKNSLYLKAEYDSGSSDNDNENTSAGGTDSWNIILSDNDTGSDDSALLWKLYRTGAYYYIENKAAESCLSAGDSISAGSRSADAKFRISMYGKNTDNSRVFCQYDPDWAAKRYGNKHNNLANSGCGILAITNAVYALNGQFIPPEKLADYAIKYGFCFPGQGTEYHVFKAAAKKYGKTYGFKYSGSTSSFSKLKKHLKNGGTAIAYVPGHYLAVSEYKNGKYLLLDSYAREKRKTSPYGTWVTAKKLKTGGLKSKKFFLFKAVK